MPAIACTMKWQREQEKENAKQRKIINGEIKQITKIFSRERHTEKNKCGSEKGNEKGRKNFFIL